MKEILKNPLSWIVGGVLSVVSVFGAMLADPTMSTVAIFQVVVENASMLFTATSIAGFTIAPAISDRLASGIQIVALGSGAIIVLKMVANFWDRLKEEVT